MSDARCPLADVTVTRGFTRMATRGPLAVHRWLRTSGVANRERRERVDGVSSPAKTADVQPVADTGPCQLWHWMSAMRLSLVIERRWHLGGPMTAMISRPCFHGAAATGSTRCIPPVLGAGATGC